MKIDYFYADPRGNITLLVKTPVEKARYQELASRLMALEPTAEQVGYIEKTENNGDIRLCMAGGEFCGNASLSTAAVSLFREKEKEGTVQLEVFGIEGYLKAELSLDAEGEYYGNIEIPLPVSMEEKQFSFGVRTFKLPVVELSGITHLIFPGKPFKGAEFAIKIWCKELDTQALGIMFMEEEEKTLTPLVYVPSADTLYWEHSCASGTSAVAAWLSKDSEQPLRFDFREPGGLLSAEACKGSLKLISGVTLEEKSVEM